MIKKIWSAHIWPVGSHAFDQNGPQNQNGVIITWDVNLLKIYLLWILILYRKLLLKFKIGPIWADWPTPPFVQKGLHCRSPNTSVSNFLMDPLLILFFCKKIEIFWNWSILCQLADPSFFKMAHNMGPQIHEKAIFSKWNPFNSDFVWKIVQKF